MSKSLRMGVADADTGARSPYWKLTVGSKKPDVYISLEKVPVHISLHQSGEWHFRATEPYRSGQPARDFKFHPPKEFSSGYIRCLELNVTWAVVRKGRRNLREAAQRAYWHPAPDPQHLVAFNIILEHPNADRTTWPQQSAGASLVGRMQLPDGWTVCAVAQTVAAGDDGPPTSVASDAAAVALARSYRGSPNLESVVIGDLADGTLCFRLMRVEVR